MRMDEKSDLDQSGEEVVLSEEERDYIKKMILRMMELGMFAVYGDEDNTEETVLFDPGERKEICRAVCCSFVFALTKEEVKKGIIKWDPKRPYFIARDEDGYCPHLDRKTLKCMIWEDRPKRCQKYDCRKDPNVWINWEKKIINKEIFKHLPGNS
ncbi:MAG: YkgJ family cysteine cluster protein [Nitrospirota bacterium]